MIENRVIVTYGWCRNAWAIMRSLARRGFEVHAGDSEKTCMCNYSRYKSGFFTYPDFHTQPEAFVDAVIDYIRSHQIGVYIPVHEEILAVAKYRDRFPKEVRIPISDYRTLFSLYNKRELWEIARRLGVSVPKTATPMGVDELEATGEELTFPLIIKMQNSNGAKGVRIVHTKEEAVEEWNRSTLKSSLFPIVQEYVSGTMHAVSLLADRGREKARFVRRNIREKEYFGGTCTKAVSVIKDEIADEASRILREVGFTGVAMFEFIVDEQSGRHWLIEANPRYWGTTALDIDAGVDFPFYQVQIARGEVQGEEVDSAPSYSEGITSRWIIGDGISLINNVKTPKALKRPYRPYFHFDDDYFMDFKKDDPKAFFGEAAYYLKKFFKYRSTNPVEEGMVE